GEEAGGEAGEETGDDEEAAGEADAAGEPGAIDDEGTPPPGFARVELIDLTTGMRDDSFASIELNRDGTIYVGTFEGRSYISKDQGLTWSESWVLPETKPFFGYPGQYMFLGKLRGDNPHWASNLPLQAPGWGSAGMRWGMQAHTGSLPPAADQEPIFGRGGSAGGLSSDLPTSYQPTTAGLGRIGANPGSISPLAGEATRAAGSAGVELGAALSARAPRLSLLLAARGRPIANISLQRLLLGVALRLTEVRKIIPDPADPDH